MKEAKIKAVLRAPKGDYFGPWWPPEVAEVEGTPHGGGKVGRLCKPSTDWRGAPGPTHLILQIDVGLVLEEEFGCVGLALSCWILTAKNKVSLSHTTSTAEVPGTLDPTKYCGLANSLQWSSRPPRVSLLICAVRVP